MRVAEPGWLGGIVALNLSGHRKMGLLLTDPTQVGGWGAKGQALLLLSQKKTQPAKH